MANPEKPIDWKSEERYWRDNYQTRPYASSSKRDFDFYRPGYQYGVESANRMQGRTWTEAEPELRRGWDRYEGRGESKWDEIKDSVRDAWERITSKDQPGRR